MGSPLGSSLDCQSCRIISTVMLTGVSGYLLYSAYTRPRHRLFLSLAAAGIILYICNSSCLNGVIGMGMFALSNWVIRNAAISKAINPSNTSDHDNVNNQHSNKEGRL